MAFRKAVVVLVALVMLTGMGPKGLESFEIEAEAIIKDHMPLPVNRIRTVHELGSVTYHIYMFHGIQPVQVSFKLLTPVAADELKDAAIVASMSVQHAIISGRPTGAVHPNK